MSEIDNNISRLKSIGYFIREIGAAGVLSITALGIVIMALLTWGGMVPSPVVTAFSFDDHKKSNDKDHEETRKIQQQQTRVLEKLSKGLDILYCNQFRTDKEKQDCFQRLRDAELLRAGEGK